MNRVWNPMYVFYYHYIISYRNVKVKSVMSDDGTLIQNIGTAKKTFFYAKLTKKTSPWKGLIFLKIQVIKHLRDKRWCVDYHKILYKQARQCLSNKDGYVHNWYLELLKVRQFRLKTTSFGYILVWWQCLNLVHWFIWALPLTYIIFFHETIMLRFLHFKL